MAILSKMRGGEYGDTKPTRKLKKDKPGRKAGPRANAWQKIRSKGLGDSLAYRDVHGEQQLERGEIGQMRTATLPITISIISGVLMLVLLWLLTGLGGFAQGKISGGFVANEQKAEMKASVELGVPQYWLQTEQRIGQSAMMKSASSVSIQPVRSSMTPATSREPRCPGHSGTSRRPSWPRLPRESTPRTSPLMTA